MQSSLVPPYTMVSSFLRCHLREPVIFAGEKTHKSVVQVLVKYLFELLLADRSIAAFKYSIVI